MPQEDLDFKAFLSGLWAGDQHAMDLLVERYSRHADEAICDLLEVQKQYADIDKLLHETWTEFYRQRLDLAKVVDTPEELIIILRQFATMKAVEELRRLRDRSVHRASHHGTTASELADGVSPPQIALVCDPDVVTEDEYAQLVKTLGDLVRSEGGAGVKLLESSAFGAPVEEGVTL